MLYKYVPSSSEYTILHIKIWLENVMTMHWNVHLTLFIVFSNVSAPCVSAPLNSLNRAFPHHSAACHVVVDSNGYKRTAGFRMVGRGLLGGLPSGWLGWPSRPFHYRCGETGKSPVISFLGHFGSRSLRSQDRSAHALRALHTWSLWPSVTSIPASICTSTSVLGQYYSIINCY